MYEYHEIWSRPIPLKTENTSERIHRICKQTRDTPCSLSSHSPTTPNNHRPKQHFMWMVSCISLPWMICFIQHRVQGLFLLQHASVLQLSLMPNKILSCGYTSFTYPSIDWWTFGLFLLFGYYESYYKHACTGFCVDMFSFLLGYHFSWDICFNTLYDFIFFFLGNF